PSTQSRSPSITTRPSPAASVTHRNARSATARCRRVGTVPYSLVCSVSTPAPTEPRLPADPARRRDGGAGDGDLRELAQRAGRKGRWQGRVVDLLGLLLAGGQRPGPEVHQGLGLRPVGLVGVDEHVRGAGDR